MTGEEYTAENILEIVKVSDDAIYFRTHLDFFNAHICDLWGIATLEEGKFVYREATGMPEPEPSECVLEIETTADEIKLNDLKGGCRILNCGARGAFDGIIFPMSKRRDIKYMDLLLNSEEYKEAVKEHEKTP